MVAEGVEAVATLALFSTRRKHIWAMCHVSTMSDLRSGLRGHGGRQGRHYFRPFMKLQDESIFWRCFSYLKYVRASNLRSISDNLMIDLYLATEAKEAVKAATTFNL